MSNGVNFAKDYQKDSYNKIIFIEKNVDDKNILAKFNNTQTNAPPNSSRDPSVGPKTKQRKKKIVGAHSLTYNISGVGGHVGAPRWD
jgi:hypothetical protein